MNAPLVPTTLDEPEIDYQSDEWKALSQISIVDFLNHDKRPAFILDLSTYSYTTLSHEGDRPSLPIYINPALCRSRALFHIIERRPIHQPVPTAFEEHEGFLTWVSSPEKEIATSDFTFGGFRWESTTLLGRWRVIVAAASLVPQQSEVDQVPPVSGLVSGTNHETASSESRKPYLEPQDFFSANTNGNSPSVTPGSASQDVSDHVARLIGNPHDPHKAKRNAHLLTKIAAMDAFGVYFADAKGELVFCNDAWYEMTELPRDQTSAMLWINVLKEDELPKMMQLWSQVSVHRQPIRYEARLKRFWRPPATFSDVPSDFPAWLSGWTYPDISPDGDLIGVYGVLTDISEQKWTEHLMRQKLALAVERTALLEQLSLRSKEVADSEARFRRLADMMPNAIWMADTEGRITYANDTYYNLVPASRDSSTAQPWLEMIPDDQIHLAENSYRQLMEERKSITFEIAFRKYPKGSHAPSNDTIWMLVSAYPVFHGDDKMNYMTGCMTDISNLKLAEQMQSARAYDALQSKRELEHFIDMTSHEMRNPLSAIVHYAEEISSSLRGDNLHTVGKGVLADMLEAAETIIYCADHSTRIVDDILLVSKLEAGLLSITPTIVRPVNDLRKAFKMFDGEMRASDITRSFVVDESINLHQVDWVSLDMHRVLQVFVNLLTNSIKFTRPESVRQITASVKASLQPPGSVTSGDSFPYLQPQSEPMAVDRGDDVVYICVTVSDTGCGLTEAEQKNLFLRFSQAGKRTHVKYGGTGLGLFISRQLCEMQGGQIGLRSVPNKGSTFSFYVMARRASSPEPESRRNSTIEGLSKPLISAPKSIQGRFQPSKDAAVSTSASDDQPKPREKKRAEISGRQQNTQSDRQSTIEIPEEIKTSIRQQTILLVEDNLVNQKVVARKLQTQGYTVLVANHGLEALDHISRSSLWAGADNSASPIALILLDMEMPVMDGLTCIRRIREHEQSGQIRSHIPVIAVTANARPEQIEQVKQAGMDDVVTKPFRMNQLFDTMLPLIEKFPTAMPDDP